MSGVEEVIPPPPDNHEKSVEKEELSDTIDGKDEDKASLTTSLTDSDSASLTGSASESWTLLEKEEDDIQKVSQWNIININICLCLVSFDRRLLLQLNVRSQLLVVLWKTLLTKPMITL